MAQRLELRRSTPLTVGTTMTQILGCDAARRFVCWSTAVDLWIVHTTLEGPVDGGALPTLDARGPILAGSSLVEIELAPFTFLAIAGGTAGACRIELIA